MSQRALPTLPAPTSRPLRMRLATAAGALLLWAGGAQAQSLQQLYDLARGYDATYLAARAQAESAGYRNEQVKALNRPSVGLSANLTRSQTDASGSSSSSSTGTGVQLSASQPLFNRDNDAAIGQGDKALASALTELESAEHDLILRVTRAYFDVLAAQDALAFTRADKTAIAEQLASARRNFEVGTATITDTREAQARFDLATAQEIGAENTLRTARIALDLLVGRQDVTPRPLATPVQLPPLQPADVNAWVAPAEDSPPVRRARLAYDVARLETERARAGHLPTVDLVGGLGTNHATRSNSGISSFTRSGTTTQAQVGVQLNLPLFAGYSIRNRVKETLALEERSRNELAAARRSVDQTTRQAFFSVQSGEATVKALEAAEASNKLALDATLLGYKVGVRVNIDVLNAQTQLFSTQRDLARARYDVIVGTLQLRQAAGTLAPGDIANVDRLLVP